LSSVKLGGVGVKTNWHKHVLDLVVARTSDTGPFSKGNSMKHFIVCNKQCCGVAVLVLGELEFGGVGVPGRGIFCISVLKLCLEFVLELLVGSVVIFVHGCECCEAIEMNEMEWEEGWEMW
jgi:hypothetical protein